jgi:cell division septation protein DedD
VSALAERAAAETVCPRCGARIGADQDWCLECGAPVRVPIRAAPDWRVPVAIVAGVVAVAVAGLVVALLALSHSANSSVHVPAAAAQTSPPKQTTPATTSTATSTPATTSTPAATSTPGTTIASWPAGVTGFTVVLGVLPGKAAANASAIKLAATGITAGVLDSSNYSSMRPGDWVVFSGTYTTKTQADAAASSLQAKGQPSAYAFSVVPAP